MVYGGALGYDFTDNWGTEFSASFIDSGTRHGDSVDVDTYFYHLDALYHFTYLGEFQPFLAAGVGGMTFDYRGDVHGKDPSATAFAFNYGGGFEYFIVENFALRGDLRHIITTDGGHNDLMGTVGITVLFGGRQAPAPEAFTPPPPPAPAPKPAPAPRKVETPAPKQAAVCIDLKVEFDFDKDDVKPEYNNDIKRVADFLKANPTFHGTIEGGTDAVGSEDYNMDLSVRRAESVKKVLVDKYEIDPARLKTVGYGKVKPIATNLTSEGRQINRRAVRVYCSSGEDLPLIPAAQKCIVLKVDFAVGSAKVDPEKYADAFKEVADYMKAHPDFVGTVEGYADESGTAQLNMDLTMKRAENVKKVLVEKYGVPANRLKAEGYGKERPINTNETVEGRTQNRYAVQVICEPE
jgi:OOP family OmpA-OmpF porin